MNIHTIILAAGAGSRMKSNRAKVLQTIGGMSMLHRVLNKVEKLNSKATVVLGHQKESVLKHLNSISNNANTVIQEEQLGTADAVKSALSKTTAGEKVLVLYGDVPLVSSESLKTLIAGAEAVSYTHLTLPTILLV